jgi:hypothetical protein
MGFPVSFFLLLNQITFFLLIVLQDKYNISVCGSARNGWKDSLKARLSPVSMSRHRNSICTVNAPDRQQVTNATGINDDVDLKITVTDTSYSVY